MKCQAQLKNPDITFEELMSKKTTTARGTAEASGSGDMTSGEDEPSTKTSAAVKKKTIAIKKKAKPAKNKDAEDEDTGSEPEDPAPAPHQTTGGKDIPGHPRVIAPAGCPEISTVPYFSLETPIHNNIQVNQQIQDALADDAPEGLGLQWMSTCAWHRGGKKGQDN